MIPASLPDSIWEENWATGEKFKVAVAFNRIPQMLNCIRILGKETNYILFDADTNYTEPVFLEEEKNVEAFIFSILQEDLNKLNNGTYNLHLKNVVVDTEGNIAYYDSPSIKIDMSPDDKQPIILEELSAKISGTLEELLNNKIKFKPAIQHGNPMPARLRLDNYIIEVNKHEAKLRVRMGC